MTDYPEVGDRFSTREELNVLIKTSSRESGYLMKQSITSDSKVRWYCSEKYGNGPVRCLGGFKAARIDGEWELIEATDHHPSCTLARQRVHTARTGFPESRAQTIKAAVKSQTPSRPLSIAAATVKSTSTPPRPGLRPGTRNSSARKLVAISPTNSSSPTSSPPSLVIDAPTSATYALNDVSTSSGRSLTVPAKKRRRSSTTSSIASAAAKAVRERSVSAGSWYSYTSEQSADEINADLEAVADGEAKTILDPSFHFPAAAQQTNFLGVPFAANPEGQSMTMLRRKRSWSGSRIPYTGYGLP